VAREFIAYWSMGAAMGLTVVAYFEC